MKAAFSVWNNRISPVFDVAEQALLVASGEDECLERELLALPNDSMAEKIAFLAEKRVGLLVCGAISRSLQRAVEARGIKVYPFCAGEVSELIQAWKDENLEQACFAMPGCGRRRCRNGAGRGNGCRNQASPRGRGLQRNRGGNYA